MNIKDFKDLKCLDYLFKMAFFEMGPKHLDFGCGEGLGTILMAQIGPDKQFYGYDIDSEKIGVANKRLSHVRLDNLAFTDSKIELNSLHPYDSANLEFVFHEDPSSIGLTSPFLIPEGKLCILDYNMKGISRRDFYDLFCFDNERKMIKKEGFEECYRKHTAFDLDDCIISAEHAGFKTNDAYKFKKYFLWIGQKD